MDYVVLENVHKSFQRRYGAPSLRAHQERSNAKGVDHALRGVTLSVGAGEAVGILGHRRSGRSTLVGVVAGLYRPDIGRARVRGRATGLIAAGAGFTGSLKVRSNIEVNAALLGYSPERLADRLGAIMEFADVSPRMLDYPLREISSSQRRRLGYALALEASPPVFLADGLVVMGRGEQQEQCLASLEVLRESGSAMIIVTNRNAVYRRLCTRGVVLDRGQIVMDGRPRKALKELRALRRRA